MREILISIISGALAVGIVTLGLYIKWRWFEHRPGLHPYTGTLAVVEEIKLDKEGKILSFRVAHHPVQNGRIQVYC